MIPTNDSYSHLVRLGADIEENGRDDSDWVAPFFNLNTREIEPHLTGTTRFAASLNFLQGTSPLTPAILAEAYDFLLARALADEISMNVIDAPIQAARDLPNGTRIRLTAAHRARKAYAPCTQCDGRGAWVNPRNPADRRECFGCHGKSVVAADGPAPKAATGESGEIVGRYCRPAPYGHRGYSRDEYTFAVRLDSGALICVSADKLALPAPHDPFTLVYERAVRRTNRWEIAKTSGYSHFLECDIAREMWEAQIAA